MTIEYYTVDSFTGFQSIINEKVSQADFDALSTSAVSRVAESTPIIFCKISIKYQ